MSHWGECVPHLDTCVNNPSPDFVFEWIQAVFVMLLLVSSVSFLVPFRLPYMLLDQIKASFN